LVEWNANINIVFKLIIFFGILFQAFSANFSNNSARNNKKYNQLFQEQVAFYRWENVPDYICFKVDYIVTDNDEF
jgi:hypothetical protein